MSTIIGILKPDADGTLHLPVPLAWRELPIRVKAELEPAQSPPPPEAATSLAPLKGFGCLRGKISMAPDFSEPLEEFKEYTS